MFSENLKTLRKQKGMSQDTLAHQLGVVRQTISKWEKGLSVPDSALLIRIAELFEVTVSDLLGAKIKDEKEVDEIAGQLALLNEQLANRRLRNSRIIKRIIIAVAVFLILSTLFCVTCTMLYTFHRPFTKVINTQTVDQIETIKQ